MSDDSDDDDDDDDNGDYTPRTSDPGSRTVIPLCPWGPGAGLYPLRHRNECSSYIRHVIRGRQLSVIRHR